MEFLALVVPPLIIVFALAMEAVEDRLLRRERPARRVGALPAQPGDTAPRGKGTPSPATIGLTSPRCGTAADRPRRRPT